MYGLINKAIAGFVTSSYSVQKWQEIFANAGIDEERFLSMESYPDEMTYKLVASASQVLGLTRESIFEAFGRYWIKYTAQDYKTLLDMAGSSLPEFLKNLDHLHSTVGRVMPALRPPSFKCTDLQETSLMLHHYTDRADLEYMVVGLIKGLGERLNLDCDVKILGTKKGGFDHNVFFVSWNKQ